jgi:hypothetical protein
MNKPLDIIDFAIPQRRADDRKLGDKIEYHVVSVLFIFFGLWGLLDLILLGALAMVFVGY